MIACATHVPAVSTVVCAEMFMRTMCTVLHTRQAATRGQCKKPSHLVLVKPVGHHSVGCLGHDVGQRVYHKTARKRRQHCEPDATHDVLKAWGTIIDGCNIDHPFFPTLLLFVFGAPGATWWWEDHVLLVNVGDGTHHGPCTSMHIQM